MKQGDTQNRMERLGAEMLANSGLLELILRKGKRDIAMRQQA